MMVEYKGRLFGDVLRDIICSRSESSVSFAREAGLSHVYISNMLNHKKYPGATTLRKIAGALPEKEQMQFIQYFANPEVKLEGIRVLTDRGVMYPYSYSNYDKSAPYTNMYQEVDRITLKRLQLPGLFKYLTEEEKRIFKDAIAEYIVKRNTALVQMREYVDKKTGSPKVR